MSRKKIWLILLLILVVLLSAGAGLLWHTNNYVIVDLKLYPKNARQLDLRDQEISVRHYEKILQRMPECEIFWNVPFQNRAIFNDTKEINISALTREDIRNLNYFSELKRVKAEKCTDYEELLELWNQRPDLQVEYSIPLGEKTFDAATEQVTLERISADEISMLDYLPNLQSVLCSGGNPEAVAQLQDYCQARQLDFQIFLGEEIIPLDATEAAVKAVTDEQLDLLQFFPKVKKLHIQQPEASARKLLELQEQYPNMEVTWELEVFGQVFSSTAEEIDLSAGQDIFLEELDQQLAYFPLAKLVFLGECGLDNELLAAHREQARDRYKLVWTVSCGEKLKSRTDATTFMPVRERVYYFNDEEAYNLRYCEDMICIDIGHMSIHNIDFVEFMPNLQYLILAHTQLQYIDPISTCKNLKFLELDWSPLRDLTPLQGCTALEDLNLGKVYADFTPIGEMTWLKNLWMVECSTAARYKMTEALPDTKVMVTGAATVANGWRNLENYYAMRDLLGMHYMSW